MDVVQQAVVVGEWIRSCARQPKARLRERPLVRPRDDLHAP
jgi:hypothetical protein